MKTNDKDQHFINEVERLRSLLPDPNSNCQPVMLAAMRESDVPEYMKEISDASSSTTNFKTIKFEKHFNRLAVKYEWVLCL